MHAFYVWFVDKVDWKESKAKFKPTGGFSLTVAWPQFVSDDFLEE